MPAGDGWRQAVSDGRPSSHQPPRSTIPRWRRRRSPGITAPTPAQPKPAPDMALLKASAPDLARTLLGDGAFGGDYQKPDADMQAIWDTGVKEVREALEGPWASRS